MSDLRAVLSAKRDGAALSPADSALFLAAAADGTATDAQCAAMLASIHFRGMEPRELAAWTDAMVATGARMDFRDFGAPVVDKHSTGGIGDKVSLALAPALAAAGCIVPMVSGRGLGHTGGTLDKLESIPGLSTAGDPERIRRVLAQAGCAIVAQSDSIAPADRRLYALRDEAELVESIPLVASSIVSKKLAEGLDALVLDVKFGSGAFFPELARGRELARVMVELAEAAGVRCTAFATNMARPLGRAVGHSLEVLETLACLAGEGPADLRELVGALGGELLHLAGVARDAAAGAERILAALDDGSAHARFVRLVEAQGGDAARLEARLPRAPGTAVFEAPRSGRVAWSDVRALGLAVRALGGGRATAGDAIDPAVGLEVHAAEGAEIAAGERLVTVHHRGRGLDEALALVASAAAIGAPGEALPTIAARITASG